MNFIKKNLIVLFIVFSTLLFPVISIYALDPPCDSAGGKICNRLKTDSIVDFIKNLLENIIKIGIPIIALAIIYSGFLFVFARGNPEKITSAKEALLYTLIGSALLLGSWALAQLISNTVLAL